MGVVKIPGVWGFRVQGVGFGLYVSAAGHVPKALQISSWAGAVESLSSISRFLPRRFSEVHSENRNALNTLSLCSGLIPALLNIKPLNTIAEYAII